LLANRHTIATLRPLRVRATRRNSHELMADLLFYISRGRRVHL